MVQQVRVSTKTSRLLKKSILEENSADQYEKTYGRAQRPN